MNSNLKIDLPLWILILFGLLGGASVSLNNFTGTACPHIGIIPICYLVTIAYALMLSSLIVKHLRYKHYFFGIGWAVAFIIAALASLAEMFGGGGICPATSSGGLRAGAQGGIPLCYLSFALLIIILVLFCLGPYKRACEVQV